MVIGVLAALHAAGSTIVLIQQLFPAAVRSTGLAFTYALGITIFGGTATYVVTWLVGITGDPLASTYYVLVGNVVTLLATMAVPKRSDAAGVSPQANAEEGAVALAGVAPASPPAG
jgi:hypothetical protein